MLTGVKNVLKSSLFRNVHVVRRTSDNEIFKLMRKLRPYDCGIELIRVGARRDGGYLIPDDLEGVEYCFSPGVGHLSEFEDQLADRQIRSYLADYSVESPAISRPEFTFDKKFLGIIDRDEYFTLATWKDKYLKGYTGDLLLQMDIEGAEYEVILGAPGSLLNQFRIVVVEFHRLDRLFDPLTYRLISACFEKLLESFYVVHIHPSNGVGKVRKGKIEIPGLMEFTFLNKRRVSHATPQSRFPHKLDMDSFPIRPMPLPKCWYSFS